MVGLMIKTVVGHRDTDTLSLLPSPLLSSLLSQSLPASHSQSSWCSQVSQVKNKVGQIGNWTPEFIMINTQFCRLF